MTDFRIEYVPFREEDVRIFGTADEWHQNWPVVYVLDDQRRVYVGETVSATSRLRQHLANPKKRDFKSARIILDDTFNKSACLDLESFLINAFAGDGQLQVTNKSASAVDRNYYDRPRYRSAVEDIFEELRARGLFQRTLPEIRNSDFFKLSPFKALNTDQAVAMEGILDTLFEELRAGVGSTLVVQGDPGTGKTIVALSLLKLLEDIKQASPDDALDADTMFSDFFQEGFVELMRGRSVGLVIPQQSLRASVKRVFKKVDGLSPAIVLSPFEVGLSPTDFDVLIVDEAHRLSRRAIQSSGFDNKRFTTINVSLYGDDDPSHTQLDWIRSKSRHQVLLIDTAQRVRPGDIGAEHLDSLISEARRSHRHFPLASQMRVMGGEDYIEYVRAVLAGKQNAPRQFGDYELRFFDDLSVMRSEILGREADVALARLVAGYAWKWKSSSDRAAFDIELDGLRLRWNTEVIDWINSPRSIEEVGSIHTVQGYDLNYAGVIIGPDLRYSPETGRLYVDRSSYHDRRGKVNLPKLGITISDDDLLEYIRGIYFVLLTRGMRGTYVYVVDPHLREYLRPFFGG